MGIPYNLLAAETTVQICSIYQAPYLQSTRLPNNGMLYMLSACALHYVHTRPTLYHPHFKFCYYSNMKDPA